MVSKTSFVYLIAFAVHEQGQNGPSGPFISKQISPFKKLYYKYIGKIILKCSKQLGPFLMKFRYDIYLGSVSQLHCC